MRKSFLNVIFFSLLMLESFVLESSIRSPVTIKGEPSHPATLRPTHSQMNYYQWDYSNIQEKLQNYRVVYALGQLLHGAYFVLLNNK